MFAAAAAKLLQSCLTLCDPTDGSPPGFPIPGILQARTLEWVAISFSNAWKWKVKVKSLSRVQLLATPWTVAHQAAPSMGFSRQEYWSGVPFPSLILPVRYNQKPLLLLRLQVLSDLLCPHRLCTADSSVFLCLRNLFKFMFNELVRLSSHLTLCTPSPPALYLSQHQDLCQCLCISWPKY